MLKMTVDSLEAIDETLHDFYEQDGDKFKLKVEGIEPVDGLKSALEKERKAARELEKKVKRWESLGKSDEEIADLLKKAEDAELSEAERKGEWDKLRAQMNEKHQAELKSRDDKLKAMQSTLERHLIDATATAAIAAEKGVPDLLLPHVQRHVRVVDEDGEFVVRVVDAKGDPRVDAKGEPLTIADLVKEMKASEIFGRAFEASGNTGSGKQPGSGSGGTGTAKPRGKMSLEEKADFIAQHGQEAYQALPI